MAASSADSDDPPKPSVFGGGGGGGGDRTWDSDEGIQVVYHERIEAVVSRGIPPRPPHVSAFLKSRYVPAAVGAWFKCDEGDDGWQAQNLDVVVERLRTLVDGRARLLDLSLLDLTEVPKELLLTVAGLLTVTTLNLAHNQLAFLPEEIKFITTLQNLSLEHNMLYALPEGLTELPLEELLVHNNHLHGLPREIFKLRALTSLDVRHNRKLKVLPTGIWTLSLDERLQVSMGSLTRSFSIPWWMTGHPVGRAGLVVSNLVPLLLAVATVVLGVVLPDDIKGAGVAAALALFFASIIGETLWVGFRLTVWPRLQDELEDARFAYRYQNFIKIGTYFLESIQLAAFAFNPEIPWPEPASTTVSYSILSIDVSSLTAFAVKFWIVVAVVVIIRLLLEVAIFIDRLKINFLTLTFLSLAADLVFMPATNVLLSGLTCTYSDLAPASDSGSAPALSESAAAASGARLDDVPSLQCWTGGHIAIAAVALVCLIVYHSAAVLGAPVWQRRDSRLQLVLKPTFLILSLEVKFALAIVANFFSQWRWVIAIGNAVLISVLLVAQIWMKPLGQFRAVDHLRTSLLLLPVFASGISIWALALDDRSWLPFIVFVGATALALVAGFAYLEVNYLRRDMARGLALSKQRARQHRAAHAANAAAPSVSASSASSSTAGAAA